VPSPAFAKEGADIAIVYLNEHREAEDTRQAILRENVRCLLVAGDAANEESCRGAVKRIIAAFGRLDILVNNAAEQPPQADLREAAREHRERAFRTNLLGMFHLTKAATPHLSAGGTIINTTAVTASRGNAHLIDDPMTTATIVSFTRSIAQALVGRRIRANAVTPGASVRSGWSRAGALDEIARSYVFLAAQGSSFMTGQVLHAETGDLTARG
jgi:NAD(P)-dependent dehydrogenase (short-subunit alcohol dehydrogenase family)